MSVTKRAVPNVDVGRGGGSFRFPGAIVAQAVSTILPAASGRYPYWR